MSLLPLADYSDDSDDGDAQMAEASAAPAPPHGHAAPLKTEHATRSPLPTTPSRDSLKGKQVSGMVKLRNSEGGPARPYTPSFEFERAATPSAAGRRSSSP